MWTSHSVDLSPGKVNKINTYVQERCQQCLCQKYILRNLNTCTCMDTKLSLVNYKLFLILSLFIMVTDKLFCTVKFPVVKNAGYVGGHADTSHELGDLL